MDIIAFVGAFLAGLLLPSLAVAMLIGAALELAIVAYQYFFTEPRVWGNDLPAEWFGLAIFVLIAIAFAWLGHLARKRWQRSGSA